METRAIYDSDKKVYKLNGSKTWLVLASSRRRLKKKDIFSRSSVEVQLIESRLGLQTRPSPTCS